MRQADHRPREAGFTLVEVLIAMAITAFVSVLSYQTLSTALVGIESARAESERLHEINRAFTVLSRDIRQLTNRPVRDEFGQVASAVSGGELARDPLRLTPAPLGSAVFAAGSAVLVVASPDFLLPSSRKSVTYQPEPLSTKPGAVNCLEK